LDSEVKVMSLNGVEYVRKDSLISSASLSSDVRIVILQRGWVYVGRYSVTNENEHRLDNAKCIRIWGTTKGLGELISGPTSSTKLDEAGTVRFNPLTVVASLDCEAAKWQRIL